MASKRFHLLFASLLVINVLVLYIISSKTENKASRIPEIPSFKENARIYSSIFTPTSTQRLKNEKTSSINAEKLFKLYDGVETFVMFIGYPRSSHSLVGAILDAHPEIIIPHEYDVIKNWGKYRSLSITQTKMQKYQLFFDLHQLSKEQAMHGIRASNSSTFLKEYEYTYHIPGLWQGKYEQRIKVIGDKKGGGTSMALAQNQMSILEEISQVVQVPMKFIHVTRNPFDIIATNLLRSTQSRDVVREDDVKINNTELLDSKINKYFQRASTNQRVRERYGDAVLNIPAHETVLRPRQTLERLCDHLGVTCSEDYIEKCSKILYGTPSITRNTVVWTEEQKERVTEMMKNYPSLKDYSFDKYPS
ncbi:uncharacterized protein LOC144628340 [Oculina patagonica]